MLLSQTPTRWLPSALAGLAASLVGIGLARFAYTPLLPALIDSCWFSESDAIYLGAANLAGYLVGALSARSMATRIAPHWLLRIMMLTAGISFLACMQPLSFAWYFVWRLYAGITGGVLMVMAASTVLPHVPQERRGLAAGIIFTGVGLGIAASGTLVPTLIHIGLAETWAALGILSIALTVAAWRVWPQTFPANYQAPQPVSAKAAFARPLLCLYAVYGLVAVGLVAHMVFLVDYIARGLGQGIVAGSTYWIAFGLGAVVGPLCAGRLADAIGFKPTLRLFVGSQAIAVALALFSNHAWALYISSILVGAIVPGVVPLIVGRVHQLSGGDMSLQRTAWSYATVAFSCGQAAAAYAFSYAFETFGRYDLLFMASAAACAVALLIELLPAGPEKQRI